MTGMEGWEMEKEKRRNSGRYGRASAGGQRILLSLFLFLSILMLRPFQAAASYYDTNLNTFIHDAETQQNGYTGQDMQLHVRIGYNGVNGLYNPPSEEIRNVRVRLSNDQNYMALYSTNSPAASRGNPYSEEDEPEAYDAWNEGKRYGLERRFNASMGAAVSAEDYPLEVNASLFTQEQQLGTLRIGEYRDISFSVTVKNGMTEGYYAIPFTIRYEVPENRTGTFGQMDRTEFVNIYVTTAEEPKDETETIKSKAFVVGEGQMTPVGQYGAPMEFSVHFRSQARGPLYDVRVHFSPELAKDAKMQPTARAKSKASQDFPYDLNEANYDRIFPEVPEGGSIDPAYSMGIKQNTAPGFYPLSFRVTYRKTPGAPVESVEEHTFFVNVQNPAMVEDSDDLGEFNQNNRTKARLIIDSYHTEPEKVYAGQDFLMVLVMKNASDSIPASNIMFSMQSEKSSDSPVFQMEGGANSIVVNSLRPGQTTELRMKLTAAPGVDPRSYTITVNEKYDSPEFKNAEEKVEVAVPVYQVARLGVSNFEIMPEAIAAGEEANVMFGINNTGKVILYNVEAAFSADSIDPVTTYVGNIKPGETGNVDAMLRGIAPTEDDGTIRIRIGYEDVNGNPFSEEKTVTLLVTEAPEIDFPELPEEPEEPAGDMKRFLLPAAGGGAALLLLCIVLILRRKRKKKNDDEALDL